ncbi:hypothetical protein PG988_003824 [Apiospora saccharicola]
MAAKRDTSARENELTTESIQHIDYDAVARILAFPSGDVAKEYYSTLPELCEPSAFLTVFDIKQLQLASIVLHDVKLNWHNIAKRSRVGAVAAAKLMHPFLVQLDQGSDLEAERPEIESTLIKRRPTPAEVDGNGWLRDDPFVEKDTSGSTPLPGSMRTTRVCPDCGPDRSWRCICFLNTKIDVKYPF